MKVCTACKQEKPLTEYSRNGDRLRPKCKSCMSEIGAKWYRKKMAMMEAGDPTRASRPTFELLDGRREEVKAARASGMSFEEMAGRFGIGYTSIREFCMFHGFHKAQKHGAIKPPRVTGWEAKFPDEVPGMKYAALTRQLFGLKGEREVRA